MEKKAYYYEGVSPENHIEVEDIFVWGETESCGKSFLFTEKPELIDKRWKGGNFSDLDTHSYPSKFYALFGLIASIYFISQGQEEYILFVAISFFIIKILIKILIKIAHIIDLSKRLETLETLDG